jgi:hypothetical protein
MPSGVRDKVFVSYSRDDRKWLDQLLQTLSPLARERRNTIWWDGLIKAGQVWREEIQRALDSAKVAVLLVSPGFLASEFILKEELPSILDAAKREGVAVLWSLVRNCWWERTPLYLYQAVPYQQTHLMKAWNTLSETELEDLMVVIAKEIDGRLRSDLEASRVAGALASGDAAEVSAAFAGMEAAAFARPEAWQNVEVASASSQAEADHARRLLTGIVNLSVVSEIGDLFVLRQKWSAAKFTYDRMVELAAPNKELWMAWGYEKLGLIHRRQEKLKPVRECWKLAQALYHRIGRVAKADELGRLLEELPAQPVTVDRGSHSAVTPRR